MAKEINFWIYHTDVLAGVKSQSKHAHWYHLAVHNYSLKIPFEHLKKQTAEKSDFVIIPYFLMQNS